MDLNYVTFTKLKRFYCVILLQFGMAPNATVCTDHVSTVSNRAKIEAKVLASNNLGVADSNGYPIRGRFFDSEGYLLNS